MLRILITWKGITGNREVERVWVDCYILNLESYISAKYFSISWGCLSNDIKL